jgi:putative transposase
MGKLRRFSPQFKREVVQQIVNGQKSRAQVCQEHQLAPRVVGRWKAAYLQQGEQAFTSHRSLADEMSLERRVSELEHLCGRLSLENEVLKKALGTARLRSLSGTS